MFCQLPCYLCEAARGGTLGGLSRGTVGMLSTCAGPGLRLLVTSGASLSYSKKKKKKMREKAENDIKQQHSGTEPPHKLLRFPQASAEGYSLTENLPSNTRGSFPPTLTTRVTEETMGPELLILLEI